ncbi:MAG: LPS assembly lipoprotein LptE [Oligoflexia bacterium]|nr:LPS assembly lipoprotein LptE [Oligoflexia bacterium]
MRDFGAPRLFWIFCSALMIIFTSCGYQFQNRTNPLQRLGIEKLYIENFKNDTYRPGIEQFFSTALIREIQRSGAFEIVNNRDEADAVVGGTITQADALPSSLSSTAIGGATDKSIDVAAQFSAVVSCGITVTDRSGRALFSQSVSGNKIYPGSRAVGDKGATVSLVNESEQRLAIHFIAAEMMSSVYQRLVDVF